MAELDASLAATANDAPAPSQRRRVICRSRDRRAPSQNVFRPTHAVANCARSRSLPVTPEIDARAMGSCADDEARYRNALMKLHRRTIPPAELDATLHRLLSNTLGHDCSRKPKGFYGAFFERDCDEGTLNDPERPLLAPTSSSDVEDVGQTRLAPRRS